MLGCVEGLEKENRWGEMVHEQIWPLILLGYQAKPEGMGSVLVGSTGTTMLFLLYFCLGVQPKISSGT